MKQLAATNYVACCWIAVIDAGQTGLSMSKANLKEMIAPFDVEFLHVPYGSAEHIAKKTSDFIRRQSIQLSAEVKGNVFL